MTAPRLSAEARADLAVLLRGYDVTRGLAALDAAVAAYGRAVDERAPTTPRRAGSVCDSPRSDAGSRAP